MTVKTVTEKISTKGDKNALLLMEDGREVWTPSYEKALPLLGKEIPADWFQKEGQYGPQAFPPKEGGGGGGYKGGGGGKATWYNSEAGVRFTQERMDRRTALMQAVEWTRINHTGIVTDIVEKAELFYDWLRETSPGAIGEGGPAKGADAPGEVVSAKGPVGANAGVSSPSSTPTGSANLEPAGGGYPDDWPRES